MKVRHRAGGCSQCANGAAQPCVGIGGSPWGIVVDAAQQKTTPAAPARLWLWKPRPATLSSSAAVFIKTKLLFVRNSISDF